MSAVIDALSKTIGPAMDLASSVFGTERKNLPIDPDAKAILSEVNRQLNMEQILPCYRYAITCSCLRSFRCLQENGHIPAESAIFRRYAQYGVFEDIRMTALELLVDFVLVHTSEKDLEWLLDIVERDPVPSIRHQVVHCLVQKPPFNKKCTNVPANRLTLVERLWQLMNCDAVNDYRLRYDLVDLYNVLWGRVTPACVPNDGFGVVIDLKGKKAVSSASANFAPASPDLNASASAGEETCSKKRRRSDERSPSPDVDSRPSTPKSTCSGMSTGSKIKLKIKLGGEENDSGSEIIPSNPNADPLGLEDPMDASSAKRLKKKKKKKHRHKERKDREKDKLDPTLPSRRDPLALEDCAEPYDSRHYNNRLQSDFDNKEDFKDNSYAGKKFDSSNSSRNSSSLKSSGSSIGQSRSKFSHPMGSGIKEEEDDSDISDI